MSSNYPEGSMNGSGIYQKELAQYVYCDCDFEGEVDTVVDDWNTQMSWACPVCKEEHTEDLPEQTPGDYWEQNKGGTN